MKIIALLVLFISMPGFLPEAFSQHEPSGKKFVIGFSQCTMADDWRKSMYLEMQNELLYYSDMQIIIKDAGSSSSKQIQDIKDLTSKGINLLIVSPNESKPLTEAVSAVYQKGIPVIVIDRRIESEDYTAFVGGNNYLIGNEAGKYASKLLNGKGSIVEIWGLGGSSPARERHKGFVDALVKQTGIRIIQSLEGKWENKVSEQQMHSYLNTNPEFDLIFAHNDAMALGAHEALERKDRHRKAFLIGVDGLPGEKNGQQAIVDHKLDATLLYPTGGSKAIVLAWNILNHKTIARENILNTLVIDSTNVNAIKNQTDEILNLHQRIITSRKILDNQVEKYHSQRFWLIVALFSLLLVIVLAVLLLYGLRNKVRANQMLEVHQQEIIRQNDELKRMSTELEQATKAKLLFFTNISHEFRTPLTLILGPLEQILSTVDAGNPFRSTLLMMHRNATRLLRMINQLMDLRKVESENMNLNAGLHDIVAFIQKVKESFDELAERRSISFSLHSENESVLLYFDQDKMDKVLFNLLSNAFKFTPEFGSIAIEIRTVSHNYADGEALSTEISIRDNGLGIKEEHLSKIFERFYQVEQEKGHLKSGTGIGLPLAKGIIDLHHGEINVTSQPGVGSVFSFYLRQGREHFADSEIAENTFGYSPNYQTIIPDFETQEAEMDSETGILVTSDYEKLPSLLIVEDDADVSRFIKSCLLDRYRILTAGNGAEAFEKIYIEEPDLIISDVMMPVMDGFEFTRKLKTDIRTCHIPLILLTALSSQENKIEGIETGADSYIPKPFDKKHLQTRVNQLIENRQQIRRHYQQDVISQFVSENKISQLDSTFLKKCNNFIENHLADNEYGVELLSTEIGLSRVHVYRKIKHLTGLTVSEFIRNVKLKKAAAMLSESGKTISEIAYETGFSSPSYFSKCFKDLYTISPTDFLQQK